MFDSSYFKAQLSKDVEAAGGSPVVEVFLVNGHSRRVRSVERVTDGYVILEVFQLRGDQSIQGTNWLHADRVGESVKETIRAAVSYESIVEVVIDPKPVAVDRKLGFMSK
jgi:hypothetical protein